MRKRFHLPDGVIYLDGNSLGPLPVAAAERVRRTIEDEWGQLLIRGWNTGADGEGWMGWPTRLGDRIGRLIGAPEGAVTCLRGNHEQMLLDVLDRPARNGPRWLRYGGLQTLASFGLRGLPETASEAQWEDLRDRLRAALGPDLEMWLRALPTLWQSGNVAVVHAGADPALPMSAQSAEVLTWGHEAFERVPRRDGVWIVHGHTIVGAYATGRLSCALVAPNQLEFLQA